jgi:hypothetical protein
MYDGMYAQISPSPRHRLTITVSQELREVLGQIAPPRKMSYWLEEAAWQRIQSDRDSDLDGIGALVDADEDLSDLDGSPRWSGLVD